MFSNCDKADYIKLINGVEDYLKGKHHEAEGKNPQMLEQVNVCSFWLIIQFYV